MSTCGTCLLCGNAGGLCDSHIIPAFVFAWQKESSGTGFLRSGQAPNLRVQDGPQVPLLCPRCEGGFNRWETPCNERIFLPLHKGQGSTFHYDDWLLKFAVSVSWRVLTYFRMREDLTHLTPQLLAAADRAERAWRDFLLGKEPHPGSFEQHMFPLDAVESVSIPNAPPNLNRYFLCTVDPTVFRIEDRAFVYAKMCRLLLIGFINMPQPRRWDGTKVHVRGGTLGPFGCEVPDLWIAIRSRAKSLIEKEASISDRQWDRMEKAFRSDMDRFGQSETFRAVDEDVRLFGRKTFAHHPRSEKNQDGNEPGR